MEKETEATPDVDDVNSAFDDIFLAEDRAAERGFKTGYVDGRESGEEEGLNFGFQKGFELGLELGRIKARAENVLGSKAGEGEGSRASKVAADLIAMVDQVPSEGLDKVNLPEILSQIRAKEKLLVASCKTSNAPKPGLSPKKDLSF